MDIRGKTAIVTGGASGIGRGICDEFVGRGGQVVVFDVQEEAGQEAVAALGRDQALFLRVDVSDAEQVARGVEAAVKRFGEIHVAVNAAGVPHAAKMLDREGKPFPLELWNQVIAINLTGTFNVTRLCAQAMAGNEAKDEAAERGVIINVASGAAWQGQSGQAAYSASKAGVIGMMLPVARDLARHGIRVLTIAPGLFDTPMVGGLPEEALDGLRKMPLFPKRLGQPSEMGSLVCSMIEIAYFNAECVSLDGGVRMI
jgi:3-hydroxyacyl-CoA dehydrogenase/3-hydroxy-2-methylbutyryl-CoA dehydrogenase